MASSSLGERLKTGGAQMSRMVSSKVKEILAAPTPESKMVDEATLETMEEPNWGLNLRICAMINSEEFNGTEIVKAIKKKLSGKSSVSQRLSLDLLETCASNCEKVFSEVASEKVLEDMVRVIQDPRTEHECREKAMQLIRGWGESEDLVYLPVFRQTHLSLKTSAIPTGVQDGIYPTAPPRTLDSYVNQQPMSPPDNYPIPDTDLHHGDHTTYPFTYGGESVEEKKELLLVTRNSLDLLSSILNSGAEPIPIKDELTVSMLDKCKQSLPVVQRIAEVTTDDDLMLFEALNLHDELQQIISRCEEIGGTVGSGGENTENFNTADVDVANLIATPNANPPPAESSKSSSEVKTEPSVETTEEPSGGVKSTVARAEGNAEPSINKGSAEIVDK